MQAQYYPIKDWAIDDRPREKLLSKSPQALSTAELLAILIGKGPQGSSALDVSRKILKSTGGNVNDLGRLSVKELMQFHGIGLAKAAGLAAALELGRRRQLSEGQDKRLITKSRDLAEYLQLKLIDYRREVFAVAYLNNAGKMLEFKIVSEGGLTSTTVDPRIILKRALELDAVSIILCHNHPSGTLKPSECDKQVTRKMLEGARFLDIRLMDHIIVSEDGYFSFADHGLI